MNYLRRRDVEQGLGSVIKETLNKIQHLHDNHKKDIVFPGGIRLSNKSPLHTLLFGLYEIIKPVMRIARREFPEFFNVLDWCEQVVKLLLHPKS